MPSILCNKCGNNNPAEARYCVSCGSTLTALSATPPQQPQAVLDEIRQLRELLVHINARLDILESKQSPPLTPPQQGRQ